MDATLTRIMGISISCPSTLLYDKTHRPENSWSKSAYSNSFHNTCIHAQLAVQEHVLYLSKCNATLLRAYFEPYKSQFALLTQTASILGCYWLRFIGSAKMKMVWEAQMIAFVLNYIFQFGNEMLITSFYASSLVTVSLFQNRRHFLARTNFQLISRLFYFYN